MSFAANHKHSSSRDALEGRAGELDNMAGTSRRVFIKGLAATIGAMLTGCGAVRYSTGLYTDKYCDDATLREKFLCAFVGAVVPGAVLDRDAIRIYTDPFYQFDQHLAYFLADLADRATNQRGYDRFDMMTLEERTAIIESGLEGDFVASRLYTAAIFMAQASVYAGIYDPDKGCEFIDFPGANMGFSREEMCYPDNSQFISNEETINGHIG